MSRREEILRKAEQLRREEAKRMKGRKPEQPYSSFGMDSERMPLGCWLWVIGIVAAVIFFLSKGVLH